MKKSKSLLVTILGIALLTTLYMYRKYHRAQVKAEQEKIQAEQAAELMQYQRQQDSIKRKKEYDSLQQEELKAFNKKFDDVKEKSKQLEETMKMLDKEIESKKKN
ncbi:MAG: hypothetical protein ED556_03595 [Winogradskyella sp.]|uniref:hypothetical protein n=1 Tax=Winogradskyella sp. TaxID=1883156 RepID=UPI000F3BDB39|nr:hypothetical protein [Winogradskyella sp.]RNC88279.1 MAG: hypothetical protein ED556_03595 [Winogradskyella sp.]